MQSFEDTRMSLVLDYDSDSSSGRSRQSDPMGDVRQSSGQSTSSTTATATAIRYIPTTTAAMGGMCDSVFLCLITGNGVIFINCYFIKISIFGEFLASNVKIYMNLQSSLMWLWFLWCCTALVSAAWYIGLWISCTGALRNGNCTGKRKRQQSKKIQRNNQ